MDQAGDRLCECRAVGMGVGVGGIRTLSDPLILTSTAMGCYFVFKERCQAPGPAVLCTEHLDEKNSGLYIENFNATHIYLMFNKNGVEIISIISLTFLMVYI